jgi:hypothetical protein
VVCWCTPAMLRINNTRLHISFTPAGLLLWCNTCTYYLTHNTCTSDSPAGPPRRVRCSLLRPPLHPPAPFVVPHCSAAIANWIKGGGGVRTSKTDTQTCSNSTKSHQTPQTPRANSVTSMELLQQLKSYEHSDKYAHECQPLCRSLYPVYVC